jgi:hypothetical protein
VLCPWWVDLSPGRSGTVKRSYSSAGRTCEIKSLRFGHTLICKDRFKSIVVYVSKIYVDVASVGAKKDNVMVLNQFGFSAQMLLVR